MEKTNVMRLLTQKKIEFNQYHFEVQPGFSGQAVAAKMGRDPNKVFKTLVTVGKSKQHFVFMIPVAKELDLKKTAKAVGEKSIEMIPQKELLPLTGYVHGGCSPIGMKKQFKTTIDESAANFETIIFSGGKVGFQVEVSLDDLKRVINFNLADLTKAEAEQ